MQISANDLRVLKQSCVPILIGFQSFIIFHLIFEANQKHRLCCQWLENDAKTVFSLANINTSFNQSGNTNYINKLMFYKQYYKITKIVRML